MSAACVRGVADGAVLRPNNRPWTLADRHVPLDELLQGSKRFERRALQRITDVARSAVAVVGPSGSGKSSFVAWVSAELPASHAAIRLPVSALGDPTDTGETLKLTLGTVLEVIDLDAQAREDIHIERAEKRTSSRAPTGITGGRIGGGSIPAQVNIEVGSLRQEYVEDKLDGEYLSAVNRVVAILVSKEIIPVFVFEDTEAIVGPAEDTTRVDGFFEGPMHKFVQEIDAPCIIAVQDRLTESSAPYDRLAASLEVIRIPHLGFDARGALARILSRRLEVARIECRLGDVLGDDALNGLVQFYDDVDGDIRKALAAAHEAAEDAASMGSEQIRAAHVRVGAANWR
jgi:hypothetical protein